MEQKLGFSGSTQDLLSIASVLVLYCIAILEVRYCIGIVLLAKRPLLFILDRMGPMSSKSGLKADLLKLRCTHESMTQICSKQQVFMHCQCGLRLKNSKFICANRKCHSSH